MRFSHEWRKLRIARRFHHGDEYKFTTFRKYSPHTYRYYVKIMKSRKPITILLSGKFFCKAYILDVYRKMWNDIDDFEIALDTDYGWDRNKFLEWWLGVYKEQPDELIKIYLMKDGDEEHA